MIDYNQILTNLDKQIFNVSLKMKRKFIIKKLFKIN